MWNVYCYGYCFMFWSCVYNNISGLTVLCWLIIRIICGDRWPAPSVTRSVAIHTTVKYLYELLLLLLLSILILIIFGGVFLVVFWNIHPRIPELKKYFNKSKSCQKYEGRKGRHNRRAAIWRLKVRIIFLYFTLQQSNSPSPHYISNSLKKHYYCTSNYWNWICYNSIHVNNNYKDTYL